MQFSRGFGNSHVLEPPGITFLSCFAWQEHFPLLPDDTFPVLPDDATVFRVHCSLPFWSVLGNNASDRFALLPGISDFVSFSYRVRILPLRAP